MLKPKGGGLRRTKWAEGWRLTVWHFCKNFWRHRNEKKGPHFAIKKGILTPPHKVIEKLLFWWRKTGIFCKIIFRSRKGSVFVFEKISFTTRFFSHSLDPSILVVVACKSQICKQILLLLQSNISRRRSNYILTTNSLQVMANFHLNQNDWL